MIDGVAAGTSTASGTLDAVPAADMEGVAAGTSTATGSITVRLPPRSLQDTIGAPKAPKLRLTATPDTAAGEGALFHSSGDGGLEAGDPYWRRPEDGDPVNLLNITRVWEVTTTNATPTAAEGIPVAASQTLLFEMEAVARQTAGSAGTVGDSAMWIITGCIKRDAANNTTLVGVPSGTGTPSAFNDAGASTWDITITADNTAETLLVTVTGEVNHTVSWAVTIRMTEA